MPLHIPSYAKQFVTYICCGLLAALADFGSFYLLLHAGLWYVAASITGSVLGFCTAFLCHKYFVFQKRDKFVQHLGKYFLVDMLGTGLATLILFALVEYLGFTAEAAKVLSMGSVICWNFFLYKFFVYT
ncbi:hypothetical protein COU76_03925 [Candidatus Peregrinibacteria bacterium CG10_big_fil_rev_8_21_14_0_10_49_10]|nr:MAG: hypothetical protein COU76_03925 [Candidatus Peregrinibacteria bacterium CG10_big_fil_rev_8_21_14_0_10_49_10]